MYDYEKIIVFFGIFYISIIVPTLLIIGIFANSKRLKIMKRIIIILSIIILLINIYLYIYLKNVPY
jgi:hypothetical protein